MRDESANLRLDERVYDTDGANDADEGRVWLRPDYDRVAALGGATAFATALFDIDGVLIDTSQSYRAAVIHATETLVRDVNGLREAPSPLVAADDVLRFKLAGGFNNDWDCTQLLTALWTARLREWRGQPLAERPLAAWAEDAALAARELRGGQAWTLATFPASAIPSRDAARWAHDEYYWGAALIHELFDVAPRYAPEASGFVHNETLLFTPQLFTALAARGVTQIGLITGREGPEVDWAVRELARGSQLAEDGPFAWHDSDYGRSPFGVVEPATIYAKPDPRALVYALEQLERLQPPTQPHAAFFIGDTADDLDVVLRYRRESQATNPQLPPILALMVAQEPDATIYQRRGADIVIPSVRDLPTALDLALTGR